MKKIEDRKRQRLDGIKYPDQNASPNLPRNASPKKGRGSQSQERSPSRSPKSPIIPATVLVSPEEAEDVRLRIDFHSARELFQPLAQQLEQERLAQLEQQRLAQLEQERLAHEQQRLAQLEQQRLAQVEQERLAQLERQRLAQIAQVFAPLDRVQNVPEPDFLKDGTYYVNKKIFEELKDHGTFLYQGPNGRCWANYPSHAEIYLQPVPREESKLFFKNLNTFPAKGSTCVSVIYKRENGEIIPIHILAESTLGEIHRLKEYQLKFRSKRIPHLAKACLIIKVKDEVAKNDFVRRFVEYVNRVQGHLDHFPIIRLCFKEGQAYRLTRELDVQAMRDLHNRTTLEQHFQNLQAFINAYERALQSHLANINLIQARGDVAYLTPDNFNYEQAFSIFSLEDIEEYESYLIAHKNELTRIITAMETRNLQHPNAPALIDDIRSQITNLDNLFLALSNISTEYRNYLCDLDDLLCVGNYRKNPALQSATIEQSLLQEILVWVEKQNLDSGFLQQFGSARVLLATMLSNSILTNVINPAQLTLANRITLVNSMVEALQNDLPRPQHNFAQAIHSF